MLTSLDGRNSRSVLQIVSGDKRESISLTQKKQLISTRNIYFFHQQNDSLKEVKKKHVLKNLRERQPRTRQYRDNASTHAVYITIHFQASILPIWVRMNIPSSLVKGGSTWTAIPHFRPSNNVSWQQWRKTLQTCYLIPLTEQNMSFTLTLAVNSVFWQYRVTSWSARRVHKTKNIIYVL